LFLSARNLVKVDVYDADKVTPVNLIKSKNIIITEEALRELEEALA
jgi:ribosomal protein L4